MSLSKCYFQSLASISLAIGKTYMRGMDQGQGDAEASSAIHVLRLSIEVIDAVSRIYTKISAIFAVLSA